MNNFEEVKVEISSNNTTLLFPSSFVLSFFMTSIGLNITFDFVNLNNSNNDFQIPNIYAKGSDSVEHQRFQNSFVNKL